MYEWTRHVDDELKKDLMRFFHSTEFLDRPNTFYRGQDPGSSKWSILMAAAALDESRQLVLKTFGDRHKTFINLVPNQVPYVNVEAAPRMDNPSVYEKLSKELIKLNKIEKSRQRVRSWQSDLNRATLMVLGSSGARQLMKEAKWNAPPPDPSAETPSIDLSQLSPPAESSTLKGHWFIAVDIESFEFDHSKVLEIGWSIFDSSRCLFVDKHYAVSNYSHLRNGKWVPDRRDCFMFGKTKWATLNDCIREIQEDLNRGARHSTDNQCVFIAHDVSMDEKYLRQLGVEFPKTTVKFDTLELNGARLGQDKKTGLGKVLDEVGIENYSLHNAGT
ncbi:hypothetical protein BGZ73_000069 [Actinomortierella ambigua]|nr:hypothetical protein BGZ73_000069 [Actinomortierella ambigua]